MKATIHINTRLVSRLVLAAIMAVTALATSHAASAATIVDPIAGGPAGNTNTLSGFLNGVTWGTELRPNGASNLAITSLRLQNVEHRVSTTLTAKVWDSSTGLLLDQATAPLVFVPGPVPVVQDIIFNFPVQPALVPGTKYRVSVHMPSSGSPTVNRMGLHTFLSLVPYPYTESTGLFDVTGGFRAATDFFPSTATTSIPDFELTVVPEPVTAVLMGLGGLSLVGRRRSPTRRVTDHLGHSKGGRL